MARAREIRASRQVEASQDELFDFLANLDNHWRLADGFVDVLALERDADGHAAGARVRMRGPLGVRREAATQVLAADPPHQMLGVAEVGRRTRAFVRWKLRGAEGGTRVRLEATVDRVGWLDRILLVLGGRRWREGRFSAVLGRLVETFAARVTAAERRQEQLGGRKS
jgi:Polyketide cyclase / dehydrase and lipid transport